MDYGISDIEKLQIVIDHLKTLEQNKFDLTTTMKELTSSPDSSESEINSVLEQINSITVKQNALLEQAATLDVQSDI
jgi:uncharacterized protein YoxC